MPLFCVFVCMDTTFIKSFREKWTKLEAIDVNSRAECDLSV